MNVMFRKDRFQRIYALLLDKKVVDGDYYAITLDRDGEPITNSIMKRWMVENTEVATKEEYNSLLSMVEALFPEEIVAVNTSPYLKEN